MNPDKHRLRSFPALRQSKHGFQYHFGRKVWIDAPAEQGLRKVKRNRRKK